jgi:bacterioferritin
MPDSIPVEDEQEITRDRLAELLNEDLSREYQAIIAYVVYSQVLKGATYMNIADQLEIHAKQELDHALIISR